MKFSKKFKSIVLLVALSTILISAFSLSTASNNVFDEDNNITPITIISDDSNLKLKDIKTVNGLAIKDADLEEVSKKSEVITTNINVLSPKDANSNLLNEGSNVLVDKNTQMNDDLKNKLKFLLNKGSKIAFEDDVDRISEALDLDKNKMPKYDVENDSDLKRAGFVIYKKNNNVIIFMVRTQDYKNAESVRNDIIWGLKTGAVERLNGETPRKVSLLKKNSSYADASGWNVITTYQPYGGDVYYYNGTKLGTVAYSLQLMKNPYNPTSDGKYWFANNVKTEVSAASNGQVACLVDYIQIGQSANGYGMVYDYQPKPQNGVGQISASISFPFPSLSYAYTPASSTDITLWGGGKSQSWVGTKFAPHYYLFNTCKLLYGDAVAEFWQNTTNCPYYNGYPYSNWFFAKMSYTVEFNFGMARVFSATLPVLNGY